MKKMLTIIVGIFAALIIMAVVITSKKKVYEVVGKITIMYNDKTLIGYTANGISYDFNGQKQLTNQLDVDSYLNGFEIWWKTNTTDVSCTR